MSKKICLITGGNAGIGKATAIEMDKLGYTTVIVTRSKEKGDEAVRDIIAESGNKDVHYLVADLGSFKSIRELAQEYKDKYKRLDALVNNAGAFFSDYDVTTDKIERQWAINHLAPFLLTNLLLDTIKASAPSRIVVVSSEGHYRGKINWDDFGNEKGYDGFFKAYTQSKLANVLFTFELARRLQGTGVTANCLHPGGVNTSIAVSNAKGFYKFIWTIAQPFLITPKKGAATSVYLASSPKVEGVTGKYFDKCKEKKASANALNEADAKRLWEVSEKMVGLA